ncbi:aKG-HExxH-type peptide beta-hydroxylase [Roseimaritima multifibrata]|nr:HEXXH motif-containing putative peptide modification protein [Roseimaritima multifibrata]
MQIDLKKNSGLLWTEASVLQWKHEKTVGVLLALDKLFRSVAKPSESEAEYRRLLAWCQQAEEASFTQVFCDPRAYHWARVAFDLVAAVHRGAGISTGTAEYLRDLEIADPQKALAYHLNQFNVFVAALAVQSHVSVAFAPTLLNTPAFLPGTALSISHPSSQIHLCGVQPDGTLVVLVDGAKRRCSTRPPLPQTNDKPTQHVEPTLHVGPQVACGKGSITLQPHAFNVPGLKDIRSVVSAQVEDQRDVIETLSSCLETILRFAPETHRQMEHSLRVIAFKPPGAGEVFNTSCSRLPGAAIFTASRHPLMLADDLIHEFYHNRLFALEERVAFLVDGIDAIRPTTFYSPWRDDPRPIYGLFHAAFVFERVHAFWISAVKSGYLADMQLAYAKSRAAKLGHQLQITLAQLMCWGEFTTEGRSICESISDSLKADLMVAESLRINGDTPLVDFDDQTGFQFDVDEAGEPIRTRDDVIRHIREYDLNHRTAQVVNNHFDEVRDFAVAMRELIPTAVEL